MSYQQLGPKREQPQNQKSLNEKIIECWLRQNHDEYQQLLIQAKEQELILLQQESRNRSLHRIFANKKQEVEEVAAKLHLITQVNSQKKHYLASYYQHLNDKLKTETSNINMFSKLDQLSSNLNQKLISEKVNIEAETAQKKSQILKFEEQLNSLHIKSEQLTVNLKSLRSAKEVFQEEQKKKKELILRQRIEQKNQYEYLAEEVKKLTLEKEHLQSSENMLKKLLNVEEVHKMHWLIIQKAIKTQFISEVIKIMHQETTAKQFKLKANQMEQLTNQRKKQIQNLESELLLVKRKRQSNLKTLQQTKKKCSGIQAQIQALSKR